MLAHNIFTIILENLYFSLSLLIHTYFYELKFFQLKENSYNSQKVCTLKITWYMVAVSVLHCTQMYETMCTYSQW